MAFPLRLVAAAACAALSCAAHAALPGAATVSSYDTPNGSGQASGGSYNYWDKSYNGSGSTTTDGAPLTGGTGDLTDGVIATQNWIDVENSAGTGPYVGYFGVDPTVTFHFAAPTGFASATFYFDVANVGGVGQPSSIDVGTLSFALPTYAGNEPRSFTADLSSLAPTDTLAVTFHRSNAWVFVSEVQFAAAVPEPSSWALMLAGAAGLALAARRRKAG